MTTVKKQFIELLKNWCEGYCAEHNLFLVDISENKNQLTFYVDNIDERITIQECARLNKNLHREFEENVELTNYIINVSSPGMSNPLKHELQYKKRVGKPINVLTNEGISIEGILKEYSEGKMKIEETIAKTKKTEESIIEHDLDLEQIKKTLIPIKISKK